MIMCISVTKYIIIANWYTYLPVHGYIMFILYYQILEKNLTIMVVMVFMPTSRFYIL